MVDVERWPRRQRETHAHLLTGASEKQIALAMRLSPHTVHAHVKRVYRRLGVDSRAEMLAAVIARQAAELAAIAHVSTDVVCSPPTAPLAVLPST